MIKDIILAFRPKTLTAALVPCLAGTALAYYDLKSWNPWVLIFALLSATFIQIGTNLINDSVDFKKGADTESRIGPKRITQAGVLSSKKVFNLGSLSFFIAFLLGIPLVIQGGWPIVLIGLVSILMGYAYTAGPFPLAYKGLGDLFVILFFGLVAVGGIYFLQTGNYNLNAFILGLQIGLLATVLIAINNLRDRDGDLKANKKTLAVRLGIIGAKIEILTLMYLPYLLGGYWFVQGPEKSFLWPLLSLFITVKLSQNIIETDPSPIYNKYLAKSALLHLSFGLLISLGFLL